MGALVYMIMQVCGRVQQFVLCDMAESLVYSRNESWKWEHMKNVRYVV